MPWYLYCGVCHQSVLVSGECEHIKKHIKEMSLAITATTIHELWMEVHRMGRLKERLSVN